MHLAEESGLFTSKTGAVTERTHILARESRAQNIHRLGKVLGAQRAHVLVYGCFVQATVGDARF
jgi:predicted neuraminidase